MTQEPLFTLEADAPAVTDPWAAVPDWVVAQLEVLNPRGRSVNGPAALVPCPRCRVPVLAGPDVQDGGVVDLVADVTCLDPRTELSVLLAGRGTVEVEPGRSGVRLFGRDRWLIRNPAGKRGRFTAPEHKCFCPMGFPVPWGMIYKQVPNHHERSQNDNECPF